MAAAEFFVPLYTEDLEAPAAAGRFAVASVLNPETANFDASIDGAREAWGVASRFALLMRLTTPLIHCRPVGCAAERGGCVCDGAGPRVLRRRVLLRQVRAARDRVAARAKRWLQRRRGGCLRPPFAFYNHALLTPPHTSLSPPPQVLVPPLWRDEAAPAGAAEPHGGGGARRAV